MSELIAFIGVGNMGNPMAQNLVKAGKKVKVFDVSKKMIDKAKEKKLDVVENFDSLITNEVTTVITMLPEGKNSKEVYLGDKGLINKVSKNCLLIDCSTIDIKTSIEIGKKATEKGIKIIDAPVSGGVIGAEKATLNIMVGGQPGNSDAWRNNTINLETNNFFKNTRLTLDQAWVRPRHNGYMKFQDESGNMINEYLQSNVNEVDVIDKLKLMYAESFEE